MRQKALVRINRPERERIIERIDQLKDNPGAGSVLVDEEQATAAVTAYRRFGQGTHPAGLNVCDCFSCALAMTLIAEDRGE